MVQYETLRCESCRYEWERVLVRGRKPRLCNFCRSDGVKLRPAAPQARPGTGTLVIDDGGKSREGFTFEKNDCTVRALAVACEAPYSEAYTFMAQNGRRKNKGAYFHSVVARNPEILGCTVTAMAYGTVSPAKGLRSFLARNPLMKRGTWILHMTRHVAVLRDGQLVDSFDSSRKQIDGAWKVSPA